MNIYVPILVRPALRYNGGVHRSRFATYKKRTSKSHPIRSPKSIYGRRRSENNTAEISSGKRRVQKPITDTRVRPSGLLARVHGRFPIDFNGFSWQLETACDGFERCGSKRDVHVSSKPSTTPKRSLL